MLTGRTQATIKVLEQTKIAKSSNSAAGARLTQSVAAALAYANQALADGDAVTAYAAASESLQVVVGWNSAVTAKAQAGTDMVAAVAAQRAAASEVIQGAQASLQTAGATPLEFVEQVPALVDAMCWGVDAILQSQQVLAELQLATTPDEVAAAASAIARAKYDAVENFAVAVDAVKATGRTVLNDPSKAWSFIDGYAGLLGKAAQANQAYATQASKTQQGVMNRTWFNAVFFFEKDVCYAKEISCGAA